MYRLNTKNINSFIIGRIHCWKITLCRRCMLKVNFYVMVWEDKLNWWKYALQKISKNKNFKWLYIRVWCILLGYNLKIKKILFQNYQNNLFVIYSNVFYRIKFLRSEYKFFFKENNFKVFLTEAGMQFILFKC